MKVGLQEDELPVRILGINLCNHALAPGMAVIQRGAEGAGDLVVGAEVPDVGQAAEVVAGAAGVSESLGLKCASAQVPEIGRVGQPESVRLGAQRQLRGRLEIQRGVKILVVHHVVEGKARILARRGQDLEESSVGRVVRDCHRRCHKKSRRSARV